MTEYVNYVYKRAYESGESLINYFGYKTADHHFSRTHNQVQTAPVKTFRPKFRLFRRNYWTMSNPNIIRLAGVSGAAAVLFAAYGAHKVAIDPTIDDKRKRAFENGNKHHFIQTIGLMLSNHSSYPIVTGTLFISGMLLFCGPCYAYSIWDNENYRQLSPIGGLLFIFAWLSFIL